MPTSRRDKKTILVNELFLYLKILLGIVLQLCKRDCLFFELRANSWTGWERGGKVETAQLIHGSCLMASAFHFPTKERVYESMSERLLP